MHINTQSSSTHNPCKTMFCDQVSTAYLDHSPTKHHNFLYQPIYTLHIINKSTINANNNCSSLILPNALSTVLMTQLEESAKFLPKFLSLTLSAKCYLTHVANRQLSLGIDYFQVFHAVYETA